jgi:hypothetical protein
MNHVNSREEVIEAFRVFDQQGASFFSAAFAVPSLFLTPFSFSVVAQARARSARTS